MNLLQESTKNLASPYLPDVMERTPQMPQSSNSARGASFARFSFSTTRDALVFPRTHPADALELQFCPQRVLRSLLISATMASCIESTFVP